MSGKRLVISVDSVFARTNFRRWSTPRYKSCTSKRPSLSELSTQLTRAEFVPVRKGSASATRRQASPDGGAGSAPGTASVTVLLLAE